METQKLLRERTTAKAGFTRIVNSIRKEIASYDAFPETIESKLSSLIEKLEDVQTKHDMYVYLKKAETEDQDVDHSEVTDKWIDDLQEESDKVEKEVLCTLEIARMLPKWKGKRNKEYCHLCFVVKKL